MNLELKINQKNSGKFISVANYLSKYYYELSHGIKLVTSDEALIGFENAEKEMIRKFINSSEYNEYASSNILREINVKIFEYYSTRISINSEQSRNILNLWRSSPVNRRVNETEYLKESINKKIANSIAFINIDDKSFQDKLKVLAENINPYTAFSEKEIELIDHTFYKKNSILTKINFGTEYFKKSKFAEAVECYENAIKSISEDQDLESLHLYFYSWALHQLGNVYFVNGDFKKAYGNYNNSFTIKIQIDKLPKPFLFATQLKIFGILSYFPLDNKNWSVNLKHFINKVSEYNKANMDHNELFLKNLIFDAIYYLYVGFTNLNDKKNSKKYFNKAIAIAKANKDFVGIVKTYFVNSLYENSEKDFNELKTEIDNASELQKNNPYLTTIFKTTKINNLNQNRTMLERIRKTFKENEIEILE